MQSKIMIAMVGASLMAAAGCATKSGTGAATGAVAGGLVGGAVGDTSGAIIGAALGGLLGFSAGRAMEIEDERRMAYALEANRPVQWQNPETGYRYEVEPTRTEYRGDTQCREFRMTADVGQRPEEVYGTACRQPDGSWQISG